MILTKHELAKLQWKDTVNTPKGDIKVSTILKRYSNGENPGKIASSYGVEKDVILGVFEQRHVRIRSEQPRA